MGPSAADAGSVSEVTYDRGGLGSRRGAGVLSGGCGGEVGPGHPRGSGDPLWRRPNGLFLSSKLLDLVKDPCRLAVPAPAPHVGLGVDVVDFWRHLL